MAAIAEEGAPIPEIYDGAVPLVDGDTHPAPAPSDGVRRSMRGNTSRDTGPELAVRRMLHASGLRYRIHTRPLPSLRRTADIVFTRQRVAVFIDGCFWHRCPQHATQPKTRASYWSEKFARNVARDADTSERLENAGWVVLRYWEHEEPAAVAADISGVVRSLPRQA